MFLVNGEISHTIDITDRGLHYGDGLFETIAFQQKTLLFWDYHFERLAAGCQRLKFPPPCYQQLSEEANQLLMQHANSNGVLKLILTRGRGGRGYKLPDVVQPTRILGLYLWPQYEDNYTEKGINIGLCNTRLSRNEALAGIKHLNRLEQILARAELENTSLQEGLMLDTADHVISATSANLFIVQNGKLLTPDVTLSGIAGVTRRVILEIAQQQQVSCEVTNLTINDLQFADEIFICNSVIGVWPVISMNKEIFFSIGKFTRQIQEFYKLMLKEEH